ncbi:MAG: GNAT family N-acetyltransferase [Thermoplasmata archaeon]|nr:GNAT family N-acetyltransferase [Thermoplasmata archaeon]
MPDDPFPPHLRLVGRYIELVPLDESRAPELVLGLRDPSTLEFFRSPPAPTLEGVGLWVARAVELARSGLAVPFATVLRSTGTAIGSTAFYRIDRPSRGVEIGATWVAPTFWRTPVNTEAKWLMLRHAFEVAHFHRVQFQTDRRNVRSQKAIEGLGAVPEARLREDVVLPDGAFRTSVYFSILEDEWPAVRARLEVRLVRPWSAPAGMGDVGLRTPPAPGPSETPVRPARPLDFRPPVTLEGRNVRLVPLELSQLPALTAAGASPEIWPLLRIRHGDTPEGMAGLVEDLLALQTAGEVLPFAVQMKDEGKIIGIARYLDIDRENRWVELGTWLHPSAWRTPVNSELKLLLLRHAFELEGVHRVQLKTDDRNTRSQTAIERLGAVFEGLRRDHYRFPNGQYRTSRYYSILSSEWPKVRERLEEFLRHPWTPAPGPIGGNPGSTELGSGPPRP